MAKRSFCAPWYLGVSGQAGGEIFKPLKVRSYASSLCKLLAGFKGSGESEGVAGSISAAPGSSRAHGSLCF
jgi:hypothetical protein